MIKFGYTILYVADVSKAVEFYTSAFGLEKKFISPDNDYAELLTGETALAFISRELGHANLKEGFVPSRLADKPFGIELGFVTTNVSEVIESAVSKGAVLVESPKEKPWGQTVAYVRDIDGFLIEICTPVG
ncbi:VOC family protein [Chitinophaga rhizophila]|uniref:VOC family protein n=1 Tax=Chitinophaga rhizophila TaxID=2866212 RepID=A0ABS7GGH4_9BACT|nr:VOC family protein [Chitinophaga rhizophila]MBW8686793.1 VOC family protein [Chitinophaga rhizophila]